ncbi:MAG: hypothetical protein U9Q68_08530 [Euryarchaeota archaeon]|nr:hypothetical protein [Euryarchaeota archaeon]
MEPEDRIIIDPEILAGKPILGRNASEGIEPEIHLVSEVDVFHLTEDSTLITVNPNLRSWNIIGSSGMLRGDASPIGSESVTRYQRIRLGSREAQSVLLTGVVVSSL